MSKALTKKTSVTKKIVLLVIAAVLFLLIAYLPVSDKLLTAGGVTLDSAGRISLGVLVFSLVLWMTEAIPFHLTGFLSLILLTVFKVDTWGSIVKQGFGSDTITFFIGVLVLSAALTRSGFSRRFSVMLLSKTGNSTKAILLGFLVVGVVLSMWITDMAVAAMLLPLAKSILDEEGVEPLKSNFGKALMLACVWGPLIGGIGTPAGCGPNPLAIGFIKDMTGYEITFLEWMTYGVPCALVLIPPAWLVLIKMFKPEMDHLKRTKEEMKQECKNLPPMDRNEKSTMVIFFITVALWLGSDLIEGLIGVSIPIAMPAVLAACLFFFPGVTDFKWKEIEPEVSWSGIILIATGISLGMTLYTSGVAEWMSNLLLVYIIDLHPLLQIGAIVLIISLLKVAFSSNTVCASILIPLIVSMAQNYNLPLLPIAIPAALTLSLAFILVTSSPTNVIPYSAGYFTISDFAKSGLVMTAIYSVLIALMIFGIGNLTGIY